MMPDWQIQTLADVCQIKPPKREAREALEPNSLVSFLPMGDLGIAQKHAHPTQAKPLAKVAGSYTYFAEGDVLLAKITPCFENGKLGIATGLKNGIGFGSSEYIVFRPCDSLDAEWLYYFLSQAAFRVEGAARMSGAVGHKRVTKAFIAEHPIPVPPLPEQKRIVAILDEAFAAIDKATANAEKNLANARELFEAHVNGFFAKNAFSQRGKLADFVEGILTGPFGSVLHKSDYVENEIPVVNPVNIVGTSILPDARKTVSTTTRMQLNAYTLRDGDVVIARRGEIGRCAVVSKHQDGWLCGTGCFVIRPSPKTVPEFLCHLLRSQPYRETLERQSGRATMPSLSNKQLAKLPIGLPAVPQQEKAISIFNALWQETERLAQVYERKRSFITELRQSILQKAFAGELTATAVEEEITV